MKISIKNIDKKLLILLLSIVGVLLCVYIYYADTYSSGVVCPNNGCAVVAESEYSKIFGIPVSILGFLYYVGMSAIVVFADKFGKYFNKLLGLGVAAGIIFTIYLRFVELFYVKAICIWCWGSVIIVALITVAYILYLKDEKASRN